MCLGIEKCPRPQETAISEGQPPSTPPSSLEREEMQTLEAAASHTHAQTCAHLHSPIIQPSQPWMVAHRAPVLFPASADEAGSAIYRRSDPVFLGSSKKGGSFSHSKSSL